MQLWRASFQAVQADGGPLELPPVLVCRMTRVPLTMILVKIFLRSFRRRYAIDASRPRSLFISAGRSVRMTSVGLEAATGQGRGSDVDVVGTREECVHGPAYEQNVR